VAPGQPLLAAPFAPGQPPVAHPYAPGQPPVINPYAPGQPPLTNPFAPTGVPPYGPPMAGMPPMMPMVPGYPPMQQPVGYILVRNAFEYPPVQAEPLSLGQALRDLPMQYKKIIFKPSARKFFEEQGKADWGIVWMQLLILMLIQIIVSVPTFFAYNQTLSTNSSLINAGIDPGFFSSQLALILELPMLAVLVPAGFFFWMGILFLMARLFKGTGTFKQQMYNQLLVQVPISVATGVLSLILSTFNGRNMANSLTFSTTTSSSSSLNGGLLIVLLLFDLVTYGIGIYSLILSIFGLMASHRLSGGRATGSVLIPMGVGVLLYIILIVVVVAVFVSMTLH
jgi:hypothetical protein